MDYTCHILKYLDIKAADPYLFNSNKNPGMTEWRQAVPHKSHEINGYILIIRKRASWPRNTLDDSLFIYI